MLIFAPSIYEDGTVAQLDRASDYGSEGLGFESLQCHKKNPKQRLGFLFAFILLQNHVKATHEEVFDIPDHLSNNGNRIREFLGQKFNVGPYDVNVFSWAVL